MSIRDFMIRGSDDLEVERLDTETLAALALHEGDLEVCTAAIIELGSRPLARVETLEAARHLLQGAWADKHLKAAAIDAAFQSDAIAAAALCSALLDSPPEPIVIDSMIRGVTTDAARFATGGERLFADRLRAVASRVQPDATCDGDMWRAFVINGLRGAGGAP